MKKRKSNAYVIQFRPLGPDSVDLALRNQKSRGNKMSSLEILDCYGLVHWLKPEQERAFVEMLVATHPAHEKNFEHFLVSPPGGIKPSGILRALKNRTKIIPTCCVIYLQGEQVSSVERVKTYHKLLSLISDAKENGIIPCDGEEVRCD